MPSESNRLADKDSYEELAPTQRAIVDARVAHPDASYAKVAEVAGANESYTREVCDDYAHIIDRLIAEAHSDDAQDAAGEEDPFPDLDRDNDYQHISDRPMSAGPTEGDQQQRGGQPPDHAEATDTQTDQPETAGQEVRVEVGDEGIIIRLDREATNHIIRSGEVPEGLRDEVLEAILDTSFGPLTDSATI